VVSTGHDMVLLPSMATLALFSANFVELHLKNKNIEDRINKLEIFFHIIHVKQNMLKV
jgi:hypothetical protein